MKAFRPTHAEVNLQNLRHNFQVLKSLNSHPWICPMVKANGYGHGAKQVAEICLSEGASAIGVALTEEALDLRDTGLNKGEILVFGIFSSAALELCREQQLTPVIGRFEDLKTAVEVAKRGAERDSRSFSVHLKFNSGMNRLGLEANEAERAAGLIADSPLRVRGLCSHLFQAEDYGHEGGASAVQVQQFQNAVQHFSKIGLRHLLSSAAIFRSKSWPQTFGSRPGIGLYGAGRVDPIAAQIPLKPVMQLNSEIVQIRNLEPGQGISYNWRWRAAKPATVGVLPVGYGDGFFRLLTNRGSALLRGQRLPLVGTVCMDYIMVDLTNLSTKGKPVQVGEKVCLWGAPDEAQLSADQVAAQAGTIAYELFTSLSGRVPRIYRDEKRSW